MAKPKPAEATDLLDAPTNYGDEATPEGNGAPAEPAPNGNLYPEVRASTSGGQWLADVAGGEGVGGRLTATWS